MSPIIDVADKLPWHERLQNEASTAAIWGAWLWQLRHVFNVWKIISVGATVEGAIAVGSTAGTLMVWNWLTPAVEPIRNNMDVLVSDEQLSTAREARINVVHHDESGRIIKIESRYV